MKDLRKIIALFLFIFAVGTGIIIGSVNQKLEETKSVQKIEISKDSTHADSKLKKTV